MILTCAREGAICAFTGLVRFTLKLSVFSTFSLRTMVMGMVTEVVPGGKVTVWSSRMKSWPLTALRLLKSVASMTDSSTVTVSLDAGSKLMVTPR